MASDKVLVFTDADFDDQIKTDVPVLIDFTATWCGPCKRLAPIIDQLAEEFDGRAKIAKVDIDQSPGIAARYFIRGVPTVLVLKGGREVGKQVGLAPRKKYVAMLEKGLA